MSVRTFVDSITEKSTPSISPQQLSYIGIFFDKDTICDLAIHGERLDKTIESPHITLAYHPTPEQFAQLCEFMENHQNDTITAKITRYGNDEKNEGFYVESISCSDDSEIPYFGAAQKHITISVSNDSSPVKTGTMDFDIDIVAFTLTGRLGAFMKNRTIQFYTNETDEKNVGEDDFIPQGSKQLVTAR